MNELELINKCVSGDNSARKRLYEIYSRQMLAICYRYVGDKMIAEDILHDGFIKVFVSIRSFHYRGEGSFKAWITKIIVNTALEHLKKEEIHRNTLPLEEWNGADVMMEEEEYERVPNSVLMNFITKLPEGFRTVFNMYTFEEMSHKEIGILLGINESTSRSQLSRAKAILTKQIKDYIQSNEG